MRGVLVCLALASIVAPPLAAQDPDDEDLEEQRRQDERYFRRYATPAPDATPPSTPDGQAAFDRALGLIRDANHRARHTPIVALDTDDPRLDLAGIERLVAATSRLFETVFDGRVDLAPDAEPPRVFLFWSYADYNQLIGGVFGRSLLRPKGHYGTMFDAIALHTDSDAPGGLGSTLVHEVSHRLVDRRLYGGKSSPATWLSEGLAEYLGRTRIDERGEFEPGVVGAKAIALFRDGKARTDSSDDKARLRGLEKALRARESPIAGPVIRADPADFYGESTLEHYAVSWLVVHWLLHDEDPSVATRFGEYLALDRRGEGGPEALYRTIGIEETALDAALLAHVGRIRVR